MIKPEGLPSEAIIKQMIEPKSNVDASRCFEPVDIEKIKLLYSMHKTKFFYPFLVDYFKGKSIKVYILSERQGITYKNGFINDFLELVGDTDPAMAKPGTIRKLSTDSLEKSISEKRALRNLVHRSTTREETEREAAIFFWDYIHDASKVAGKQKDLGKFLAREGPGIFYEERLESGLKKHGLLSPDEELISYQDLGSRKQDTHQQGYAIVTTLKQGSLWEREITLHLKTEHDSNGLAF
jgi:nucleoside diphosphate kinase